MAFAEVWDQAPTMLQPVGGMDAIIDAFKRRVGERVLLNAEVVSIRRSGKQARITWRDVVSGRQSTIEAHLAVCTIPLPVLTLIDSDFSDQVKNAISVGAGIYVPAVKVAFQSRPRWWEYELGLYGGISWTAKDITQMWYPSHGFHDSTGIIVGAYIWNSTIGAKFAAMTPAGRASVATQDAEALHPSFAERVTEGVSVAWSKVPYSMGGWAEWDAPTRSAAYGPLLAGDGPFIFAGEHMSYINGWQEGAVQSAHYAVARVSSILNS
jgi:monoamine oxidase